MDATSSDDALRLTFDVWHPGCWVLEVTEQIDVGFLGYGVYTRDDGQATTHFTTYADTQATIEEALDLVRAHPSVHSVSEMTQRYRQRDFPAPGNARCELLVEHDGTTQISEAFTSRGFVYAEPGDIHGESERWTVFSTDDRSMIRAQLDEIRDQEGAEIAIQSISRADRTVPGDSLPIDQLTHRQREVFQLARKRGYYRQPKATSAGELATELDITTSTVHEHLHNAEEKLLDLS